MVAGYISKLALINLQKGERFHLPLANVVEDIVDVVLPVGLDASGDLLLIAFAEETAFLM